MADSMSNDRRAHPTGNAEWLQSEVIPLLRRGLRELLVEVERERLRGVSGIDWDADGYLPKGCLPFDSLRWLGEWLTRHSKTAAAVSDVPEVQEVVGVDRDALLMEVFDHLDEDKAGRLCPPNLVALVGDFFFAEDLRMAGDLLHFMDTNGDGYVDPAEFKEAMSFLTIGFDDHEFQNTIQHLLSLKHLTYCNSREAKLGLVFDTLDKDASGSLNMEEIIALAFKIDPHATEEKINKTLDFLDKDHSGEVDKEEFVKAMMRLMQHIEGDEDFDMRIGLLVQATPVASPRPMELALPRKLAKLIASFPAHSDAEHIVPDELVAMMMQRRENVLLIDVRTPEERAVSTIEGSISLEAVEDSQQKYGYSFSLEGNPDLEYLIEDVENEEGGEEEYEDEEEDLDPDFQPPTIIAFCATGLIGSSAAVVLSERIRQPVLNLYGGLINYYNSGGPLVNSNGVQVDMLHPGERRQAGYIKRRNKFSVKQLK